MMTFFVAKTDSNSSTQNHFFRNANKTKDVIDTTYLNQIVGPMHSRSFYFNR